VEKRSKTVRDAVGRTENIDLLRGSILDM